MMIEVHAAGGEFVQQRLPQMRARAVHQRDARAAFAAEPVAEPRGKFETTRAAADNDDLVEVFHEVASRCSL